MSKRDASETNEAAKSGRQAERVDRSRRGILRGTLSLGGIAALGTLAACSDSDGATGGGGGGGGGGNTNTLDCEIPVDPSYDDGQLLYRRNDGGDATGDPLNPISEGQTFGDMIIKSSAMFQMHGHMSHMETTVGPKTIIAPHVHDNADQLVVILGIIDESTAVAEDELLATTVYTVDPRYTPGMSPPALMFQFDPDTDNPSEIIECPVGSYVIKPRGRTHAFWNPLNQRVAYCEISTGTDFEHFVRNHESVETLEDLERLEEESSTYFADVDVLARLMFEHRIPNIKGMGGINDAVQDIKAQLAAAIQALAAQAGIPVPPELMSITIDTD